MKRIRTGYILLILSVCYWVVVLGAVFYDLILLYRMSEVGFHRPQIGCHQMDALLIGIECRGFLGAELVEWVLTIPWAIFQLSILVFSPMVIIALPLWILYVAPLVYPFIYLRSQRRQNEKLQD